MEEEKQIEWTHKGMFMGFIPVYMSLIDFTEESGPIIVGRWFWCNWLLAISEVFIRTISFLHPNPSSLGFTFTNIHALDPKYEDLLKDDE